MDAYGKHGLIGDAHMVSLSALPALQIDTNLIGSDSVLGYARLGEQDRFADEKRQLAKDVGAQAASGNYLAAARTAFKGGDLDTGQQFNKYRLDMNNMGQDQKFKVAKFMMEAGGKADTPEKWKAYTTMASNIFGAESVAPYMDFNNRPGAMTEMERVTAQIEQQIKQAELSSKLNDATYGSPEKLGKDDRLVRVSPTTGQAEEIYRPSAPQLPPGATVPLIDDPVKKAQVEEGIRKEVTGQAKDFVTVRDSYKRLENLYANTHGKAGQDPEAAAADIGMVYSVMKMFDPGSVVRETEYATAQNAAGVPDRVRAMWNRVLTGERLTPPQRADFLKQGRSMYAAQEQSYRELQDQYRGVSKRSGVDPENAVIDLGLPKAPEAGNVPSGISWNPAMTRFERLAEDGSYQPVPQVKSANEAMQLPPGSVFITPDGRFKTRP